MMKASRYWDCDCDSGEWRMADGEWHSTVSEKSHRLAAAPGSEERKSGEERVGGTNGMEWVA